MIAAIALDLGSTSVKAGLLQRDGALSDIVSVAAPGVAVDGGRYESDALAYAHVAEQVLAACLSKTSDLPPLGLCSQRSSFLVWEKASGQPITPLISWQDTRGAASCEALRDEENVIRDLSGLRLTPYYFAPKLRILLQEHPQWRARLERGELLVGTLDTFLIWRWTGGGQYITDASMAARTLLMDVRRQQWSPELCKIFSIPLAVLPQIRPSTGLAIRLDNGLTLQASVGDQSAAFFASIGTDNMAALVNLGTGGFVMRDMAQEQEGLDGYLRTLLYQNRAEHARIALEGTLNSIAAALAPYPVAECCVEELAQTDIFCLAEPSGLGAPYFRNDLGILFSHPAEHLSPRQIGSLLLEAIVFRVARILEEFHRAAPLERVYLSGGLSELPCLQQGIAQCVPALHVYRLQQRDSSLQGAALLAAGMQIASNREAGQAVVADGAPRLPEKYRRWKDWFDALLASQAR
ncbi:MAG: FGGY family carbohydrate kinase [Gallionellaceae bacterium]